jgi:quercetin dioxygenase-like cupin family protein
MSDPIARPTRLADLVAYQPDSVVSRVLLRNQGGVMTLFAFAEGQGLAEHSTPHDATVQVLEGSVRITVGGDDDLEVAAGEIVRLPASLPHTLHGGAPFKMLLTMLRTATRE